MNSITPTNVKKHTNWFKSAFNAVNHGQATQIIKEIAHQCECSEPTVYRWMNKGFVPKQRDLVIICNLLNLDVKTRQPKI